jgi:hypothetical protein
MKPTLTLLTALLLVPLAALAAAREGARVFVVNRLYASGGNIGPGMPVGAFVGQDRNTGRVSGLDKDRTYGGLA